MYVAYIINHIHPCLNDSKKSNLLINVSGGNTYKGRLSLTLRKKIKERR
jgi:hypothetical protein